MPATTIADRPPNRPRRTDPDRKTRISAAAVEVIAEFGVAGTTHRRVAAAADVPLGSLTYHFDGLDDLLRHAFGRHAEDGMRAYAAHFAGVTTREQLVDAVVAFVHHGAADAREWVVNYELYLAAQRDPALREITERWMRTSREVLRRHVDADTAHGLDALIEGLTIHTGLSTGRRSPKATRLAVAAVVSASTR